MNRQHHLCENCLRKGIYKPADIVHHLIELTPMNINNPEITLNPNNLEALCRDCHVAVHGLEGGQWSKVNQKKREDKAARQRYAIDGDGRVKPNEKIKK